MLPQQLLGKDGAHPRDLYEALRFLVDRALVTDQQVSEGKITVRPGDAEGMFEVYATRGRVVAGASHHQMIPLFTMDELDFGYEHFVEACPESLEQAIERALLGPRTSF